jgi:non-ribosomal peptide synthase protein (TIGR01720 family)
MSSADTFDSPAGIAVIGMSGRFPGARNVDEFWQNLREGVESISFFTAEELLAAGVPPDELNAPNYVRARGYLEGAEEFDAAFFGIGPREAEIMDPQQRLFLECAWEAFERAGYDPEAYEGRVGVYAGSSLNTYLLQNLCSNRDLIAAVGDFQIMLANDRDYLSTRLSYKLNLKGPSITVQTACSTSLVAVHLACQSLLGYQCDMAIAGGVSVTSEQKAGYFFQEGGVASPDGRCRAFDAAAHGTVSGSGVGIVVLKRLEDAVADRDNILSVIKGSAINNDGSWKIGYTAPSIDGQAEVIAEAQALAGVTPETISYVETHGTGTSLGDPIEISALTQAFGPATKKKGFCAIGSVKTNIGHLDTAAGVASLIKTTLALNHKLIPPSLHFQKPNPQIDFENSPFRVNTELVEWKLNGAPRRAGVSSFGIGGTNAHAILEEYRALEENHVAGDARSARSHQLIVLSAKTGPALDAAAENLARHLKQHRDLDLADVAYTLQAGRRGFNHRRMLVCRNPGDAAQALEDPNSNRVFTQVPADGEHHTAWLFPGQGAQYAGMGEDLYRAEPVFREQVDQCSEWLRPHLGFDLRESLYPSESHAVEAAQRLRQTAIAQPAIFVTEYALAKLWWAWGLRPQAMLGHSIGEYVAACLAGVFSLEEGLSLVAERGRLMQGLPGGSMLAVPLPEQEVRSLLSEPLSLAAVNGPSQCVVAGPMDAVESLQRRLAKQGQISRLLNTSHAFHSRMMEPILESFVRRLEKTDLRPPRIPYLSNLTGTWITAAEATSADYWAAHLRQAVRFADGVNALCVRPEWALLEVGPGQTLSALVKRQLDQRAGRLVLSSLPQPQHSETETQRLLTVLGKLWLAGVKIDWERFHAGETVRRVPLPTYPFERKRYWIAANPEIAATKPMETRLERKPDVADWFYAPCWKQSSTRQFFKREEGPERQSCWLVLCDKIGLGAKLARRLEQEGHRAIMVSTGEKFARLENGGFAINFRRREDYDTLFEELRLKGEVFNRVLHLWNFGPENGQSLEGEFQETSVQYGYHSLLFLMQAISDLGVSEQIQISVISNQLQSVTGEEEVCPEKATLLGPCKVIRYESPNISCRSIDLAASSLAPRQEAELLDQLYAELITETPDQVVAYRGRRRWVQTFEAVPGARHAGLPQRLRQRGVYLITGGLGGVGLEIAGYLALAAQARLVLTGRSSFPARDEWPRWLAEHDPQNELSRKIRQLQSLEEMGAEALYLRADIADREQTESVIARTLDRFGALHGVIHAAGVAGGGMIQRQTPEMAEAVLASKVRGARALEAALRHIEPDFFILCSSQVSILGGFGRVEYCAANAFLDLFAHYYRARYGVSCVAINWDTWQEAGMAVNAARQLGLDSPPAGMLSREGVEAFSRILDSQLPQIIVSTQDFNALIEQQGVFTASRGLEELEQHRLSQPAYPRPQLETPYVAPGNDVERKIAAIWRELLGISEIGVHDNFFELGGDSVVSIQVIARASQAGLRLTPKQVFDSPTIAELAAAAGVAVAVRAEQGLITGAAPLTPIQHWFFEQGFADAHHYNQEVLFEVPQSLDPLLIEQAVQHLLAHHDALRLRFVSGQDGWIQTNSAPDDPEPIIRINLSALPAAAQSGAIEAHIADLQASLDISQGPLLKVAHFDLGAGKPGRLFIVVHHLAIDGVSWRALLEDLETAYQQLSRGDAVRLPAKTTSFRQWSERLAEYAQSEDLRRELAHWAAIASARISPLPVDSSGDLNTAASAGAVETSLSAEETRALLQDLPQTYHTQVNDALLTSLTEAFAQWTGSRSLLIDLEGHGREALFEDIDVSRTVGWFTTIFPVPLDLEGTFKPSDALKRIKEQLRRIPNNGFGYGALRYLSRDHEVVERLQVQPRAEVAFLYLGQFNLAGTGSSPLLSAASECAGPSRSSRNMRKYLFEVTAAVVDGELKVAWIYSQNIHRRETVENLAERFLVSLRALIGSCRSAEVIGYTPSDFAEFGWDQTDLDDILNKIGHAAGAD